MKKQSLWAKFFLGVWLLASCNNEPAKLTRKQSAEITGTVTDMAGSIAKDLSREGPVAWNRYFETTPNFFMASDGNLVFPNNDSATNFINGFLVKNIVKIGLRWDHLRIDPLTTTLANMAADFHEDITDIGGKTVPTDGYFTGVAEKSAKGWQLRNAHWSIKTVRQL